MKLHDLRGEPAEAADQLLSMASGIPLTGVERSCKFSPQGMLSNRLLMANTPEALRGTALERAHLALKMPESLLSDFERDWAAANHVYLGFEGSPSGLSYRIYLEFPVLLTPYMAPGAGGTRQALLARGYKWPALLSEAKASGLDSQAGTSEYWWEPRLTADQIVMRLEGLGLGMLNAHPLARAAMDAARPRSNALDWTWLVVQEPASPRRSYDLNLYSAELTLKDVAPAIDQTAQGFGIDPAQVSAWLETFGHQTLGHVSGGISRNGQSFVTVYHAD